MDDRCLAITGTTKKATEPRFLYPYYNSISAYRNIMSGHSFLAFLCQYPYRSEPKDYIMDSEKIVLVKYYKTWKPDDLVTLKNLSASF